MAADAAEENPADLSSVIEELPFAEDAKINAILILQRRIFQLQAESLENEIDQRSRDSKSKSTLTGTFVLPPILARRNIPDEMLTQNRILDDVEMTLLGILDSSGTLSLCSRIAEFIIVMTRVIKVEHRALCLHILSNCMESKCGQSFITFGGLRLLKRWIKVAEEEDCVSELRIIVNLCKVLPFDGQAVKDTEIGKSIKKLLKFRSHSTLIDSLYADVKNLMQHWTNHLKSAMTTAAALTAKEMNTKKLPSIVAALSERLLEDRGHPTPVISAGNKNDSGETSSEFSADSNDGEGNESSTSQTTHVDSAVKQTEYPYRANTPGALEAFGGGKSATFSNIVTGGMRAPQSSLTPSPSNVAFGTGQGFGGLGVFDVRALPAAKRATVDGMNIMAEKAKQLLQNQSKSNDMVDMTSVHLEQLLSVLPSGTQSGLLKGGLKRKNETNDAIDAASNKKTRLTVLWADENGGTLRDVMTFEVERIKNTIKDYKSHRDLVRKERQLEKDLHLNKTKEVMHPAVEWRRPDLLVLSIDIRCGSRITHTAFRSRNVTRAGLRMAYCAMKSARHRYFYLPCIRTVHTFICRCTLFHITNFLSCSFHAGHF